MTNIYKKALQIRSNVAKKHNISIKEIISKTRKLRIIKAKHEAWYWTKEHTDLTYQEIGTLYNNDGSVVQRGVQKHAKIINKDFI